MDLALQWKEGWLGELLKPDEDGRCKMFPSVFCFPETLVTARGEVYNHDEARECLVEAIHNRGRWVLAYVELKKGEAMESCF